MLTAPAGASAAFLHVVAPGESLSSVAAADGLSVESLAAANGLPSDAGLTAGSTVMIPPQAAGAGEPSGTPQSGAQATAGPGAGEGAAGEGEAQSAPGESEGSSEAQGGPGAGAGDSEGASPSAQAGPAAASETENDGDSDDPAPAEAVQEGPAGEGVEGGPAGESEQGGPAASAESAGAAASQPEGASAEGSAGEPPYPTSASVSPSEVGSIASENGVPPSLAQAIAEQESGFNNNLTSPANARGEMQILPGTWSWINEKLASSPLDPSSAESNVRGGVLLLHSLLEATGGNSALAAAGYYQGLPSVIEHGEEPSTEQYVGSVLSLQQQYGGG